MTSPPERESPGRLQAKRPRPRVRKPMPLIKRATKGDESVCRRVRALLADGDRGESYRDAFGSSAEWFRRSLIEKAGGDNLLIQEAIEQKLDELQSELEGPNPTPIERLLAERASLCWFIVHWYETPTPTPPGGTSPRPIFQHRKIDKAHARFLSALRTLAQVRKLALPTLQVNIAKNQVNVAETRS